MEDIPRITENYMIKKNNKECIICLNYSNSSIEIKSSFKESFQKFSFSYEKSFTLDELKKISNFFFLFNNIKDII